MRLPRICAIAFCAAVAIPAGTRAQDPSPPGAQNGAPQPGVTQPPLTTQQLDELVAPVALYPDALLADVLTASTYPLEVVEADRWITDPNNPALSGDALADALNGQDWDPSVKSLVPISGVLEMMDAHLDWLEQLGEAFLADPGAVMEAVQRMRARAQSAGNLSSNGEQTVTNEDGDIDISPPPSDEVDVPQYDPWCAFGDWSSPPVPPYYYSDWPGYCEPAEYAVEFGPGIAWPFDYWDWGYFDWRHHRIRIHRDRYEKFHSGAGPRNAGPRNAGPKNVGPKDDVWHHETVHRAGVPYSNPHNVQNFGQPRIEHEPFQGYQGQAETVRPERRMPPTLESFGPGPVVHMESQRGMTSRGFSGGFHFGGAPRGGGSPGHRGH
ncbi:MAG TPA: DUF3300 domain-containing protein [Rhizomicrobium sp.]|jgi:hypothetical protein|nr:DUF3300 domain-containing protein [Rhizomicrobium sp.]